MERSHDTPPSCLAPAPLGAGPPVREQDNIAYTHDGTLEGLLCAVFAAYENKAFPSDIAPEDRFQARLGQQVVPIPTDEERARRVHRGICRTCGPTVFEAVKAASLSDDPHAGSAIHAFIRYAMAKHRPLDCGGCPRRHHCDGICTRERKNGAFGDITHPAVAPFNKLVRAVGNEQHRIRQFLRFEHFEGGLWFAQCNPAASVVPLVMDWFAARFNTQPFMIYDEVHRLAGVYEGEEWYLVKADSVSLPEKAADEAVMQQAWKRFYRTVAVESRYNPELRRQFMPKRYWRNIVEMHEDVPAPAAQGSEGAPPAAPRSTRLQDGRTPLLSKGGMKLS